MKRKRKLIPLELQKQADKVLDVVPELQGVDDIDRAADLVKEYTNMKDNMNAYAYAYAFVMSNHWRRTKLIYEFDKTLVEELTAQTDLAVASEMLKRLPFECAYIMTPNLFSYNDEPVDGFMCLKRHDVLQILFVAWNKKDGTTNEGLLDIHLDAKTLEESDKLSQKASVRRGLISEHAPSTHTGNGIIQLLLYLCAANADVKERRPTTVAKKTPKASDKRPVRHWDVGVRVGATIKRNRSYAAQTQRKGGDHKQHARPRPHLRRGHWSHFWTGKRDSADRERILKWIEPVYINADSPDDLPTTIHKVK
jgi:hypothetical protein|nr:MAG TPA: hypothetical protein [Caudoviricetes sp.]